MSKIITNNITPRSGSSVGLTGDLAVTGNVSVAGTITYEDVTNVDSVGIITARSDVSIADKIIHTGDTNTAIRFPAADTFTVETAGSERLRVLSDATIATGGLSATPGTVAAGSIVNANANAGFFTNGYDGKFGTASNHPVYIQVNGSSKLTIATSGNLTSTGTISDSIGPLRRLGVNAQGGAYVFVVGDAGKIIRSAGSGAALTLNQNIFTAGDMISVFNVSGGNNTVVQGTGVTLYNTADAATGTRTIAAKGMATIVCTASNEFAISGSQLT